MKKVLALLALVIVGGGLGLVLTNDDFGDLFDNDGGQTHSYSVSGGWYEVYFVPGDDVEARLIDLANDADKSIYAAIHELSVEDITTAFIDAHNRGVEVKVVIEKDYSDPDEHTHSAAQYDRLDELGLVKTDDRSALMHNKFVVIDNRTVWTGSANLTERGVNHNNNNVILIESVQLAENFTTEFNEMWDGAFGITSPSDTPYPELDLSGTLVETYFAPEDGVEDQIVKALEQAQESIYFATFSFTSDTIEEVLLAKADEEVEIKGIYETTQESASRAYCSYTPLQNAGIPALLDGSTYSMHHKFLVIDEETVITGSFNLSNNANRNNDENILIIQNSIIAEAYYNEFNSMWEEWYES